MGGWKSTSKDKQHWDGTLGADKLEGENVTTGADPGHTHSDSSITGTLTDDSMADALHRHSELSASDGSPDKIVYVDTNGVLYADYAYGVGLNVMHSAEIGDHLIVGADLIVNGDVGIGTATPEEKLHISGGDLLLDNNVQIKFDNVGGTPQKVLTKLSDDSTSEIA